MVIGGSRMLLKLGTVHSLSYPIRDTSSILGIIRNHVLSPQHPWHLYTILYVQPSLSPFSNGSTCNYSQYLLGFIEAIDKPKGCVYGVELLM